MAKAKSKEMAAHHAEATSRMLKAVADSDRLKIVHSLRNGAKNVSQLAKILGAEMVNVSHHLSVLRASKVVAAHKKGRFVYYTLHPDTYKASSHGDSLSLGMCKLELSGK
jgi:DNA-binding transcriptional ArsR family regulator